MSYINVAPIVPFWGFTNFTPALPDFYWDVYSAEERYKTMCMLIKRLICYANELQEGHNVNAEAITELQNLLTQFMEHGFDDYYKQQVTQWFKEHFQDVMNMFAQHLLFFGLTEDGYFCAWQPEMWAFVFDTGAVYENDDYGRLCIKY